MLNVRKPKTAFIHTLLVASLFVCMFLIFRFPLLVLFIGTCLSFLSCCVSNKPIQETILIFPSLGIQIESQKMEPKFYCFSEIEFFTVNEGFEKCRVVVYLALVTLEKNVVVLFNETRPEVNHLLASFEVLDSCLLKYKMKKPR